MIFDTPVGKCVFPVKPIAEGCEFISGYAFKGKDFVDAGNPVIKIKNIQNGKVTTKDSQYVSDEVITDKLLKFRLYNGDILIAMTGQGSVGRVGKLYVSDDDTPYLNQRVGKFVADEKTLNKDFLYYVISTQAYENHLFAAGSGSGQPNLSPAIIKSVEIPYPPYDVQCYIGESLKDIDEKIELNSQTNQTLENIAQAIFKSWFVDFEPTRAKISAKQNGQDPERAAMAAISGKTITDLNNLPPEQQQSLKSTAALFPDTLTDSELGEIPEGWSTGTLDNLCDLNKSSWTKKNSPQEVVYVDLANTKNGVIEGVQHYSWSDAPSRAKRILSTGDTIIGTVRPGNRSFSLVGDAQEQLTGSTGFAVLSPQKTEYVEFLYVAAVSDENIDRLAHLADGGAYPAVRPDVVTSMELVIPPDPVILLFSQKVSALFEKRSRNLSAEIILQELRDTLLPKLLSGEINIDSEETA